MSSTHGKEKQDLIEKSKNKLDELEIEKKRWENANPPGGAPNQGGAGNQGGAANANAGGKA